jgi:hydroxyacylglutathione hydrolase
VEKQTNPFLRAPALLPGIEAWEAFADIRKRKDNFKS